MIKIIKGVGVDFKPPKYILGFKYIKKIKSNKYLYLCKCGKMKTFSKNLLSKGGVKCSCINFRDNILNKIELVLFKKYIYNAKKRNYQFLLNQSQFKKLIYQNCHFCGTEPKQEFKEIKYNGIDRLEPNKGYIETNVFTCCFRCNRAKSNMSFPEFDRWMEKLVEFQNNKNILLNNINNDNLDVLNQISSHL